MKISTLENTEKLTLKIEGKIVGEWATELEHFWKSLQPSLSTMKVCLDICGVSYMDGRGKLILHKIFAFTRAEILADSPLTKQFASEIRLMPHGVNGKET